MFDNLLETCRRCDQGGHIDDRDHDWVPIWVSHYLEFVDIRPGVKEVREVTARTYKCSVCGMEKQIKPLEVLGLKSPKSRCSETKKVEKKIPSDESIRSVKEHFARIHDELKHLDERLKVEALGRAVKDSFAKKVDWK